MSNDNTRTVYKGGLISEDILTFVPMPKKVPNHTPEHLNKLFTVMGGKFKFSTQESDLTSFFKVHTF